MTLPKKLWMIVCLFFLLFTSTSCDILLEEPGSTRDGLQASGIVETIEIMIAPEIGGRIAKVYSNEGDRVESGDVLFELEDKLLVAQLHQAEAALDVAQANYNLTAAGMTEEQRSAAISSARLALAKADYEYTNLYKNTDLLAAKALKTSNELKKELENLLDPELQQALAKKKIAQAKKAIEHAERQLRTVKSRADDADIAAAKAQVVLAKDALDDAREDFEPYENKPEDNLLRANYQAKLAAAQQVYDAAVRKLNALQSTGSTADIAVAEADLAEAEAQLSVAEREWERIKDGPDESDILLLEAQISKALNDYEIYKDGPDPDDVSLIEAQVTNAENQLALALAEFPTLEELEVARGQIETAKANLEAIRVQIDLLKVRSPIDGVVLNRNVEIGEVIQPGLAAMAVGQLDKLTITVYIPEDKYGKIRLGDIAFVKTDSFPEETFSAQVIRIADQAEYTPRNVQTKEDRVMTVYAIELSVDDPTDMLKPGMPTDVFFDL